MNRIFFTVAMIILLMAVTSQESMAGRAEEWPAKGIDGIDTRAAGDLDISFPNSLSPMMNADLTSYPRRSLFVHVVPGYSRIYNADIYEDDTWTTSGGFGFGLEVGYAMRISKLFNIGLGLGVSSYQSEISIDEYENSSEELFEDVDKDKYKGYIELSGIMEKTQLIYLDVPVYIEMGRANTGNVSWYVRLGVKVSYPLSYNYSSDGAMTLEGYYQKYYSPLYGIPELGFVTDMPIDKNEDNILNTINLSAMFSAGVTIPVSDYFILKAGGNLNYGLMEISSEKVVTKPLEQYSSLNNTLLTSPGSKTTVQSLGLEIGIIYILQAIY